MLKISNEDNFNIRRRLYGQIFDSPVDLDFVPIGMSNGITDNWILNRALRVGIGTYLALTFPWVTQHYLDASKAFRSNELKLPALFLYSTVDSVSFHPDLLEEIMNDYKKCGIDVWGKCWPDSKHVSHYQFYPEEYIS